VSEDGARLTRRQLLGLAGAAAAGAVAPAAARAQAPRADGPPKRGGTIAIRGVDQLHFDPMLTSSFKTHTAISFTHSRLVRHKAGPSVTSGTFPLEGDLAESWTQPNETTYVFKLRRGARWQPKPPVNGRELTAEDVRYSFERFLTVPGNYKRDLAEARRLLAAAGHGNGLPASICFTAYGSAILVDQAQLLLAQLKEAGIDARLDQKEYGAYFSTCFVGKFDSMAFGPQPNFLEPDGYLAQYLPGEARNQSHVKNYGPNLGYDLGGRLTAAWLDR
jgi:ABC-type transport system substrate-binding protein